MEETTYIRVKFLNLTLMCVLFSPICVYVLFSFSELLLWFCDSLYDLRGPSIIKHSITKWKPSCFKFQTAKRALISRRQQAPKNWTSAASFEFRAFWRKKSSSWPARNWVKISQGKSASKEGWEQLLKILCAIVAFFAMVSFFSFFLNEK